VNLKQLREKAGLTQEKALVELRYKSGGIIDISLRTLHNWEANDGATGKPSQVRFYRDVLKAIGEG